MTCPNCGKSMVKMFFRYFDRMPPEWYEWYCNDCSTRLPVALRNDHCKKCRFREVGCHIACEDHKTVLDINAEKAKKKIQEAQLNDYVKESIRRVKQARNGWDRYRRR